MVIFPGRAETTRASHGDWLTEGLPLVNVAMVTSPKVIEAALVAEILANFVADSIENFATIRVITWLILRAVYGA